MFYYYLTITVIVEVILRGKISTHAGEDFAVLTPSLSFNPAWPFAALTLSITEDEAVEGEENVTITLVPPPGISIDSNTDIVIIITDNDIDPCIGFQCPQRAVCSVNASIGPLCECTPPYVMVDSICQHRNPCHPYVCHQNATCEVTGSGSGMSTSGSGVPSESGVSSSASGVSNESGVSSSASGVSSSGSGMSGGSEVPGAICQCSPSFLGNGTHCTPDPCYSNPCSEHAMCEVVFDDDDSAEANCTCLPSFIGNGLTCIRESVIMYFRGRSRILGGGGAVRLRIHVALSHDRKVMV